MHFGAKLTDGLAGGIAIFTLLIVGFGLFFLAKFVTKKTIYVIIKRTPSKYDDLLIKNKVFIRICLLIPAILVKYYADDVLPGFPDAIAVIIKFAKIYEIIVYTSILVALVNTAHDLYNSFEMSKNQAHTRVGTCYQRLPLRCLRVAHHSLPSW